MNANEKSESDLTTAEMWNELYRQTTDKDDIFQYVKSNAIYRQTAKFIEANRDYFLDADIVELGCGDSQWLPYFHKRFNCRIAGVDYSEVGIEKAGRRLQRYNVRGELFHATIEDFARSSTVKYGAVVSFGLLEHFADRAAIYEASVRLLKDRGVFFAMVPNLDSLNLFWANRANHKLMTWHISTPMVDVVRELKSNGFEVLRAGYVGGPRLFAESEIENPIVDFILTGARKAFNGCGEVISRFMSINGRSISPYYCVTAQLR